MADKRFESHPDSLGVCGAMTDSARFPEELFVNMERQPRAASMNIAIFDEIRTISP